MRIILLLQGAMKRLTSVSLLNRVQAEKCKIGTGVETLLILPSRVVKHLKHIFCRHQVRLGFSKNFEFSMIAK